jgi:hypothetical protein
VWCLSQPPSPASRSGFGALPAWQRDQARYAFELLKLLDFVSFNAGSAVPTLNRNHGYFSGRTSKHVGLCGGVSVKLDIQIADPRERFVMTQELA